MSGSGSYAVSRTHGGDRFYNPPAVRRQQQLLLQQQQQLQQQRKPAVVKPALGAENRTELEGSAALSKPASVCSSSSPPLPQPEAKNLTNLDRFIESVTPLVQAHFFSEANRRSWKGRESELHSYYGLDDLWESFGEWSVYGVGVPLVLHGEETTVQYYVPFLSGLQLYVDPQKLPSRCRRSGEESNPDSSRETSDGGSSDCEADRRSSFQQNNLNSLQMNGLHLRDKPLMSSSSDEAETGVLVFEYMEHEQPHNRKPLADKISALASQFPELRQYKSCELLPSSWISVAWYPIYRIPVGPTLKDLDASFLTFHALSTNPKSNNQSRFHNAVGRKAFGGVEAAAGAASKVVPLPVFGLASYKLKGSILSPSGPLECQLEKSLLQAADSWLRNLQVFHPDYQFFVSHYSHWR